GAVRGQLHDGWWCPDVCGLWCSWFPEFVVSCRVVVTGPATRRPGVEHMSQPGAKVIGMQTPQTVAAAPARRLDPAELEALLERVDALAEVPVGPELAAALAAVDCDQMSGEALVGLLQARNRQANHAQGELLATVGRVMLDDTPLREEVWLDPALV